MTDAHLPDPFRALARTIVPEAETLDEAGWERLEGIIVENLRDRPEKLRRQLALFIRVAGWLPRLRYGRGFESLDADRRARFLATLESFPLLLIRRGFWGLRTLVYMGYYCQEPVRDGIGYRAHPRGWEARKESGDV